MPTENILIWNKKLKKLIHRPDRKTGESDINWEDRIVQWEEDMEDKFDGALTAAGPSLIELVTWARENKWFPMFTEDEARTQGINIHIRDNLTADDFKEILSLLDLGEDFELRAGYQDNFILHIKPRKK